MDSSARREKILQILQESSSAVTGTALSKACNVSRQIIVGDVAILRAQGIAIISTPPGLSAGYTGRTGLYAGLRLLPWQRFDGSRAQCHRR